MTSPTVRMARGVHHSWDAFLEGPPGADCDGGVDGDTFAVAPHEHRACVVISTAGATGGVEPCQERLLDYLLVHAAGDARRGHHCPEAVPGIGASAYGSGMAVEIVFETHSWSEDNDRGIATGWNHGRLSPRGEVLARELGERRRNDGITTVFTSDLGRAAQTASLAFEGSGIPVLHDWRLRECDYGTMNGMPSQEVHAAVSDLHESYPGGESWLDAMARVSRFLDDLSLRWMRKRVLVIGHVATLRGLAHRINQVPLDEIRSVMDPWREGWEFEFKP